MIFDQINDNFYCGHTNRHPQVEKLPAGIYTLMTDIKVGYYFKRTNDKFQMPSKVYGSTSDHSKRILNTFENRSSNTGVLFSGAKGSGKTLLTKKICNEAIDKGYAVVIINTPYIGDSFNTFIASMPQNIVFLFDEFEKTYATEEEQNALLTLLDGVFNRQNLFLLTSNTPSINQYLINRPGRIFYSLEFKSVVEDDVIKEFCTEKMQRKEYIADILKVKRMSSEFNFDIMAALVEETNRYNESPLVLADMMNITKSISTWIEYIPTVTIDGVIYDVLQKDMTVKINRYGAVKFYGKDNHDYCFYGHKENLSKMKDNGWEYTGKVSELLHIHKDWDEKTDEETPRTSFEEIGLNPESIMQITLTEKPYEAPKVSKFAEF